MTMRNPIAVCSLALFGLSATAYASGRYVSRRNTEQVAVTQLEVSTVGMQDEQASLELKLDVQVNREVGSDVTLTAVTTCTVNGQTKSEKTDLGSLSDVSDGESKHIEVTPFANAKLDAPPTQCDITIHQNRGGRTKSLAHFCYADGQVASGACR
jgi:hypothetical protein